MPKVSIVVPVYNAARFLEDTIRSVQAQTEKDWELLLVDDCSTDESCDVITRISESDSRVRLIHQAQNAGAAAARNRGICEAAGKYLAYLDADDLWKPERLSKELAFLEKEKAAFVFCGYEFADENGHGTGKVVRVPKTLTYHQALKNTTIFTSTVLFDMTALSKELLQMPLVKSEDTATWWKILRAGYQAHGLDENLVLYRRTAGTLSSDKLEAVRRIWFLYRKVEGLSALYSMYNFIFYAIRAVLRRV